MKEQVANILRSFIDKYKKQAIAIKEAVDLTKLKLDNFKDHLQIWGQEDYSKKKIGFWANHYNGEYYSNHDNEEAKEGSRTTGTNRLNQNKPRTKW